MEKNEIEMYSYDKLCEWALHIFESEKYSANLYSYYTMRTLELEFNDETRIELQFDHKNNAKIEHKIYTNVTYIHIKWCYLDSFVSIHYINQNVFNKLPSYDENYKCLRYAIANDTIESWNSALDDIESDLMQLKESFDAFPDYREIIHDILSTEYEQMQRSLNAISLLDEIGTDRSAAQYYESMQQFVGSQDWKPIDIIRKIESDPFRYANECPLPGFVCSSIFVQKYAMLFAKSCL